MPDTLGRDTAGRFRTGNPGSRNRKPIEKAMENALRQVVAEGDLTNELRKLRQDDPVRFLELCSRFARPVMPGLPVVVC